MAIQSNKNMKEVLSNHINLKMIAKGILVSYLSTIPLFLVFSFVLSYMDFPEKFITPVVLIITVVSVIIAGSTATRKVRNKGWMNGSIVGLAYIVTLYLLSSIVFGNFAVDSHVALMAVLSIVSGSIGGIIGINLKRSAR